MKLKFKEWSTAEVNDLPDSSFAYISSGGTKDEEGKTTPRSLRHLPYKDADGKPDLAHVRNALARLNQTDIPESAKTGIKSKLEAILEKAKASDKHFGMLPLQFDEDADAEDDNRVPVPDTIHVIPVGSWQHDLYGEITITASDIREFVMNFNAKVRNGVFITAGHEGMQELPAVGWFSEVEARPDGLWGKVDWNDEGKELLSDKAFKFFSPEFFVQYEDPQTHQMYRHVLTGGALTKEPYFKELTPIVFSEPKTNKFNEPNTMDLTALVAKKVEELTDEEKAFLKEHKAELTEEQKTALTAVIDEPETPEQKEAREKKEAEDKAAKEAADKAAADAAAAATATEAAGTTEVNASEKSVVQISASELAVLRKKADEGQLAFAELQKQKLDAAVTKLVCSESNKAGKFLPKSQNTLRAFMETLSEAQRAKFSELLNELPKTQIFSEVGTGEANEVTETSEVEAKVQAKMKADSKLKYSEALKIVMSEEKGLEERYDRSLKVVSKKQ